jgi:ribonuclease-3
MDDNCVGFVRRPGLVLRAAPNDQVRSNNGRGHTVNSSEPPLPDAATDIHLVDENGDIDSTSQASKLVQCQEIVEYQFNDEALLLSALTHASGASHRL